MKIGNIQANETMLPYDTPLKLVFPFNRTKQEASANIVSGFYPSPKSFWSCTHVDSYHNYTLYINLHILLNILCKATLHFQ